MIRGLVDAKLAKQVALLLLHRTIWMVSEHWLAADDPIEVAGIGSARRRSDRPVERVHAFHGKGAPHHPSSQGVSSTGCRCINGVSTMARTLVEAGAHALDHRLILCIAQ